jgi:hypothetical protein
MTCWGFSSSRWRVWKLLVFWVVAPCRLVEVYQRFRRPYCLHHQGDDSSQFTRRYNPEDSHLHRAVSSSHFQFELWGNSFCLFIVLFCVISESVTALRRPIFTVLPQIVVFLMVFFGVLKSTLKWATAWFLITVHHVFRIIQLGCINYICNFFSWVKTYLPH